MSNKFNADKLPVIFQLNLLQFFIYLRAYSTVQWSIIKQVRAKSETQIKDKTRERVGLSFKLESFNYSNYAKVKVKVTSQLTVSRSACFGDKAPIWGPKIRFLLVRQLRVCWGRAPSLMRGRVCRLQLLLTFASAVNLASGSHGTHDHILVSQIRDSPNLVGYFFFFLVGPTRGSLLPLRSIGLSFLSFLIKDSR
jgi:hypothetical protein